MKTLPSLGLAAFIAFTAPAFAGEDKTPDAVGKKEARQAAKAAADDETNLKIPPELRKPRKGQFEKLRKLIVQGILANEISADEAKSLESELSRVERLEYLHKRNGKLSGAERSDVNRDLNRLHERITKKTAN